MWPLLFAAGIGLSAYSSYMQGQAQAEQYAIQEQLALHRAKIAEADAKAVQRKTDFEQQRQILEAAQGMGTLRVRQAAAGAQTDVGTPVLVRVQQWAEYELENFLVGLKGRTEKSKLKQEAAYERVQAKVYGKAAKRSVLTGLLGAGANVLQGIGAGYGMGMWGGGGGTTQGAGFAGWGRRIA